MAEGAGRKGTRLARAVSGRADSGSADSGSHASPDPALCRLLGRDKLWSMKDFSISNLAKHRSNGSHRKVEVKRVVLKRNEPILQIKPLRVVILGEQIHAEHSDPSCDVACHSKEVEQERFTKSFAAIGEINSNSSECTVGNG